MSRILLEALGWTSILWTNLQIILRLPLNWRLPIWLLLLNAIYLYKKISRAVAIVQLYLCSSKGGDGKILREIIWT